MKKLLPLTCQLGKPVLLLVIACFAFNTARSQTLIKGTVTTDSVHALADVRVEIQGSTTSTTTDQNGNYTITAGNDAILVFKLAGYTTQEVYVNGRTVIDVMMQKPAGLYLQYFRPGDHPAKGFFQH